MPSLELINVSVHSEDNRALLCNLDCRFVAGEFAVLTGQNGSGKSLFLSTLNGAVSPQDGKLMWGSKKIRKPSDFPLGAVQIVPQNPAQSFLSRRVEDEIGIGLSRSVSDTVNYQDRMREALEWSQLSTRSKDSPFDLSFCEQRLLAIASALSLSPQFLILDDPLSSFDRAGASKIIDKLVSLAKSGVGIIVACQDIDRLLAHADRLVLLKQGRIIADGLPARVLPFLEAHGVRKPGLKLEEMTWLVP